jgi:hypothetical protein
MSTVYVYNHLHHELYMCYTLYASSRTHEFKQASNLARRTHEPMNNMHIMTCKACTTGREVPRHHPRPRPHTSSAPLQTSNVYVPLNKTCISGVFVKIVDFWNTLWCRAHHACISHRFRRPNRFALSLSSCFLAVSVQQ